MNAAVTIVDTFSRSVSDSWGTTDTGQLWLNEVSAADVNGTYGTISVTSGASYRTHYIDLSANDIGNQGGAETLAMVRWSSSSSVPSTDFGLTLRQTSTNTFYFCSLHDNTDTIELGVYINGTRWQLNQTGISLSRNVDYWIRYEVTTSGCYVKVWRVGTSEPGGWTLTSGLWGGSNPPDAGDCGVFYKGTTSTYTVQFSSFYFYTGDDDEPGLPQTDSFDRVVSNGFGVNASGTVWQGNVVYDPEFYVRTGLGSVSDPGDGLATLSINETVSRYGLFGPRRTSDAEVYTEFAINSAAGNTFFYVGLRGRLNPVDGEALPTGYGVYIASGATNISIRKCDGGTWGSALATSGAITALVSNTKYSVRFQVTGGSPTTVVRARIWVTGAAEPGTWTVTYTDNSPIGTSGSSWFELAQSVTTSRNLMLYRWDYQLPTSTVVGTQTTTTTLTASGMTDSTLGLRANFTGDTTGMNNTVSVRWRPTSSSTWRTDNVAMGARASTYWPFTISGLTAGTTYYVEATYSDVDGLSGTNPIRTTFTTTMNRVEPGVATIQAVGPTSVILRAPYVGDNDNDSTATIQTRVSSSQTYIVSDRFNTSESVDLETHLPEVGSAWVKRDDVPIKLNSGRAYVDFSEQFDTALYTNNDLNTSAAFSVSADLRIDDDSVSLGLIARYNSISGHYYLGTYNGQTKQWQIIRWDGTWTVLESADMTLDADAIYGLTFAVNADYKALYVDGVEVARTTDNTISAAGAAGLWALSPVLLAATPYASGSFDNFLLVERQGGGSFDAGTAMTADRVNKRFDITKSSLLSDTVYEFKITYTDPDGVRGVGAIQYLSAMTTGQSVTLSSMTFSPQYTSAVVYANYAYDSNSNSELAIQYRSTMETMWTTLPQTSISVNRGALQFSALLSGLRPGMSYVVRATISDPNGVIEGGVSELTSQFTTLSTTTHDVSNSKQYLWKVYNREDQYVGTWPDAGVPEFSWHLDSGLGDCNTELNRPYASLTDPLPTIDTMYRVDIIATAPGSTGLTPNMLVDRDFSQGMWSVGANAAIQSSTGPDGGRALRLLATSSAVETISENITITPSTPITASVIAQSKGTGRLKIQFRAYDNLENVLETSNSFGMTVGSEWQKLTFDYSPPRTATYVRLVIVNDGAGTMYASYPFISHREMLVYRGFIQSYEAQIDEDGERIEVDLYSQSTLLSDDFVEWLQFVTPQPAQDAVDGKPNRGEADPSDMLKALVDLATQQNPRLPLYYTDTSIKQTGKQTDFTFEDMSFEEAFESIIALAPLNWHFNIAPDGLVSFFSSDHVVTHKLRLGVEITEFSRAPNVSDLKNYIVVYGTQEEDKKVKHVEFDQESINIHGRRVEIYNESGIESDRAAEIWAEGKLAELSQPTVAMEATIPDLNSIQLSPKQTLRGYTIEQFKPGDLITVTDPVAMPEDTLWDQFMWDVDSWDSNPVERDIVDIPVPIKSIDYKGESAKLEMAEKPPSVSKEHARLWRYIQKQERKQRLGLD